MKSLDIGLLNMIEQHKEWLDSIGHNGAQLYLTNQNLSSVDLSNIDFTGAILFHSSFEKAKLNNTLLHDCNLASAKFDEADLTGAKMNKANLEYASLVGAILTNATIFRSSFMYANLMYANLSGADLRSTNFFEANLEGAILRGANLAMTSFRKARLYKADFKGAIGIEESFKAKADNLEKLRAGGADMTMFEEWIDVGPVGSPVILRGEEMRNWLLKATTSGKS